MKTVIRHPRTGETFITDLGVKVRQRLIKHADGKVHRIIELLEIRQLLGTIIMAIYLVGILTNI